MTAICLEPGLALVRLCQLASPTLPIGAYSYSQGLEAAVDAGIVHDAATAKRWIGDMLALVVAPGEGAVLSRLLRAAHAGDGPALADWNDWLRASRETAELRAESEQMGEALVRWARELGILDRAEREIVATLAPVTLPAAFAIAARALGVPAPAALVAFLWSWLENQVLAAMKSVPLGQFAGQRILFELGAALPTIADGLPAIDDAALCTFAPGLAIASSRHEVQYSRLFRS